MTNPAKKLYNVTQLRKLWWRDARRVLISSIPLMGVSLVIAAAFTDMLVAQIAQADPAITAYLNNNFSAFMSSSIVTRVFMMFPLGMALMVPLVLASNGPFPTERQVALNQMLRRAAGMSDEVSTETDI